MNIYKKGITKKYPSNLSIKPPCPGISFPLSFTPIFLLKKDSKRSPEKANMPIKKPLISEYIILELIKSFIK